MTNALSRQVILLVLCAGGILLVLIGAYALEHPDIQAALIGVATGAVVLLGGLWVYAVVLGLEKVLEFIKAGVTAEEVERCWRDAIAHTGLVKPSRIGYSYGLNYVPDWGEHTISLRPGDKTVLVPNMTLHVMPGIWLEAYGFECSEPIRVTDTGCESLSQRPMDLVVK